MVVVVAMPVAMVMVFPAMAVGEALLRVRFGHFVGTADARHGELKIFGAMRVVVAELDNPLVQLRVTLCHPGCGPDLVFLDGAPRVVVKMVEQLGVHPPQGDTASFAGEGAVVDVGRPPEVTTSWHRAKLHHPGVTPQVV